MVSSQRDSKTCVSLLNGVSDFFGWIEMMKTARDKSSELFSTPEIGAAKIDRTEILPNAKVANLPFYLFEKIPNEMSSKHYCTIIVYAHNYRGHRESWSST